MRPNEERKREVEGNNMRTFIRHGGMRGEREGKREEEVLSPCILSGPSDEHLRRTLQKNT